MKKSGWIVILSAVGIAMGFGHAGCYTSGVPGGTAMGGAPAAGGRPAADVDAGSNPDAATNVADDAASAVQCDNDLQCNVGYFCDGHLCVQCRTDADCVLAKKGNVCENHMCVTCLQDSDCGSSQRCFQNTCIAKIGCTTDRAACSNAVPRLTCGSQGYCVECMQNDDCVDFDRATCSSGTCNCDQGICLFDGKRVAQQTDAG